MDGWLSGWKDIKKDSSLSDSLKIKTPKMDTNTTSGWDKAKDSISKIDSGWSKVKSDF